jgi:hypothetical protein
MHIAPQLYYEFSKLAIVHDRKLFHAASCSASVRHVPVLLEDKGNTCA